jgi:two-component system, cell cycle response regulator
VFDLDHFTRVNDTKGRLVGDQVLVEIAARLAAMSAPGDAIGRVGGEEFAWLIAGRDERRPTAQADRLRERIANDPIAGCAVTISVGVAIRTAEETPSVLYRSADNALYAAKAAGRNTVVAATDGAPAAIHSVWLDEQIVRCC